MAEERRLSEEDSANVENYFRWKTGLPRTPANPYADPDSPESKAVRDGSGVPGLKPQSTTLSAYKKECRDGGKGNKEDAGPDVAGDRR